MLLRGRLSPFVAAHHRQQQQRRRLVSSSRGMGATTTAAQNRPPLDGIRVLDMTRVLAGPYCTMTLGDLGATVYKIEEPTKGDDTRAWGPPFAPGGESAYFLAINRNKKSLAINMKHPAGSALLQRLAVECDVLVENYIPGKLDAMGLGYEQLSRRNPRLVYASITGYGPTGPYAKNPGYDVIIEAEAGLMHITGERHGDPVKVGVAITDLMTGISAHGAIMAALYARERTGQGQKVDLSLLETQVAALANIGSNYLIGGKEAARHGTSHPSIVPYQSFATKDAHIVLGAGNDRQFISLCKVMDAPEWSQDPRFLTNSDRVKHREELLPLLRDRFAQHPTAYWLERLKGTGLPNGPVNNMERTFAHPQVLHRDMVVKVQHPIAGEIKMTGIPVKYSKTKPSIRLPPPMLGQHTDEVLSDVLGLSSEELSELRVASVIR